MTDYPLETNVYFRFTTRSFSTGSPSGLGSGAVSVMEDGTDAAMTAVSATVVASSVTGLNLVTVSATAANGFESGKEYDVYVSAGTVSGVSIVGEVVGHFSINKASALRPTTASRTLDVSAGGEAGVDWANVGSPTTAVNLSATNIDVDQVVASVSGAVGSVTGAVGSVTGNVGGNVAGSVGSVTGAVGSVTGAVGSVTGNVGGNVTGTVAGVTPATAAQVAAVLTTQITEAYRANGAAPTLAQFMSEVLAHLGEASISTTTKTINKFDHVTAAATFTLDSATDPSSVTRAT